MTAKKKPAGTKMTSLEPVRESQRVQEPVEVPPGLQGTCINCRYLQTGQWFGPRCSNPTSPNYKQHMSDSGTCSQYTPKQIQPVTALPPEEGLYDPEPAHTALEELLDRETEPIDVPKGE